MRVVLLLLLLFVAGCGGPSCTACAASLLLRAGADAPPTPEAMACLEKALEIARQQGARGLELRAALGLSPCWHRSRRRNDARRLLADVHGRFTEGAGTADLQAAQALLATW
ncbi:MAG TPA: hypothetical protein VL049_18960 [Candidatus Dormibacteraeota bacterium]|nr:hypothetical protein [Candidatus Dormibacteraeota bacterium]